jgi:CelD/BcsL family acetyltransferase involved in cellulose biosynthesis
MPCPATNTSAPPDWEVRRADTVADCRALAGSWRELLAAAGGPTLNTDPDYYLATVDAFGEACAPDVTILRDEDGVARAAVVGRSSTRRLPSRVGHVALPAPRLRGLDVVYGGVLTDGTTEAITAIGACLGARIRRGSVDHVMINRAPLAPALADALAAEGVTVRSDPPQPHWRRRLPADGNVLATFSRKHRGNVRRADRRLVAAFDGDARLERITEPDELAPFAEEAAALTASGYQQGLGAGFRNTPAQRAVLEAAARRGDLRCYVLRAGGAAAAIQVGVLRDDIFHLQATAFRPDLAALSPGQVLLVRVLEDLAGDGCGALDFGFGDAPYKRVYGNESWEEATIHVFRRHPRALAARCVHRASTFLHGQAASRLAWAKHHWRAHLERAA